MATAKNGYFLANGDRVPGVTSDKIVVMELHRFMCRVVLVDSGCWHWRRKPDARGYGIFTTLGKNVKAHRWSYECFNGPIPAGFVIDHLCRNKICVNPNHLDAVTQQVNVLRGKAPAAQQARRTHCIHGHALFGGNVYIKPNGGRQCKICRRATDKRRYYGNS